MSKRTVMIFPEFENIDIINHIRKKYDPLADLVSPHITLVFPFDSQLTKEELHLHLKECLSDIEPFKIKLKGFSTHINEYGNYLFLNIVEGKDIIRSIHDRLYNGELNQSDASYHYVPHMTVGKVPSVESLDEAFDDVNQCDTEFNTVVKMISVEMIGENEESIIIEEYELHS
ncbi:MAG: 2'-5' RNA ligase family protein [Lacrimispora sp.]|uniref:2'-5' RNA ligase family protein n=1 Tax=Lacrimispora sp. TaxID=2719234 RepID=UPI0039E2D618